jgi:hypothetical protein
MHRRIVTSILSVLGLFAWPLAAQSATYTINWSLKLTNMPAPAGTMLQAGCFFWTSSSPQLPVNNGNYVGQNAFQNVTINGDGAVSANLALSVSILPTAAPFKSYTCGINPGPTNNNITVFYLLPDPSSDPCKNNQVIFECVTGTLP